TLPDNLPDAINLPDREDGAANTEPIDMLLHAGNKPRTLGVAMLAYEVGSALAEVGQFRRCAFFKPAEDHALFSSLEGREVGERLSKSLRAGPRGRVSPFSQLETVLWSTPIASPSWACVSDSAARRDLTSISCCMARLWKTHSLLSMSFS